MRRLRLLTREKGEIHAALGVGEPAEIVALAERLRVEDRDRCRQVSAQIARLEAERDLLFETLQRTSTAEVITLVTELREHLADLLAESRSRLSRRLKELDDLSEKSQR